MSERSIVWSETEQQQGMEQPVQGNEPRAQVDGGQDGHWHRLVDILNGANEIAGEPDGLFSHLGQTDRPWSEISQYSDDSDNLAREIRHWQEYAREDQTPEMAHPAAEILFQENILDTPRLADPIVELPYFTPPEIIEPNPDSESEEELVNVSEIPIAKTPPPLRRWFTNIGSTMEQCVGKTFGNMDELLERSKNMFFAGEGLALPPINPNSAPATPVNEENSGSEEECFDENGTNDGVFPCAPSRLVKEMYLEYKSVYTGEELGIRVPEIHMVFGPNFLEKAFTNNPIIATDLATLVHQNQTTKNPENHAKELGIDYDTFRRNYQIPELIAALVGPTEGKYTGISIDHSRNVKDSINIRNLVNQTISDGHGKDLNYTIGIALHKDEKNPEKWHVHMALTNFSSSDIRSVWRTPIHSGSYILQSILNQLQDLGVISADIRKEIASDCTIRLSPPTGRKHSLLGYIFEDMFNGKCKALLLDRNIQDKKPRKFPKRIDSEGFMEFIFPHALEWGGDVCEALLRDMDEIIAQRPKKYQEIKRKLFKLWRKHKFARKGKKTTKETIRQIYPILEKLPDYYDVNAYLNWLSWESNEAPPTITIPRDIVNTENLDWPITHRMENALFFSRVHKLTPPDIPLAHDKNMFVRATNFELDEDTRPLFVDEDHSKARQLAMVYDTYGDVFALTCHEYSIDMYRSFHLRAEEEPIAPTSIGRKTRQIVDQLKQEHLHRRFPDETQSYDWIRDNVSPINDQEYWNEENGPVQLGKRESIGVWEDRQERYKRYRNRRDQLRGGSSGDEPIIPPPKKRKQPRNLQAIENAQAFDEILQRDLAALAAPTLEAQMQARISDKLVLENLQTTFNPRTDYSKLYSFVARLSFDEIDKDEEAHWFRATKHDMLKRKRLSIIEWIKYFISISNCFPTSKTISNMEHAIRIMTTITPMQPYVETYEQWKQKTFLPIIDESPKNIQKEFNDNQKNARVWSAKQMWSIYKEKSHWKKIEEWILDYMIPIKGQDIMPPEKKALFISGPSNIGKSLFIKRVFAPFNCVKLEVGSKSSHFQDKNAYNPETKLWLINDLNDLSESILTFLMNVISGTITLDMKNAPKDSSQNERPLIILYAIRHGRTKDDVEGEMLDHFKNDMHALAQFKKRIFHVHFKCESTEYQLGNETKFSSPLLDLCEVMFDVWGHRIAWAILVEMWDDMFNKFTIRQNELKLAANNPIEAQELVSAYELKIMKQLGYDINNQSDDYTAERLERWLQILWSDPKLIMFTKRALDDPKIPEFRTLMLENFRTLYKDTKYGYIHILKLGLVKSIQRQLDQHGNEAKNSILRLLAKFSKKAKEGILDRNTPADGTKILQGWDGETMTDARFQLFVRLIAPIKIFKNNEEAAEFLNELRNAVSACNDDITNTEAYQVINNWVDELRFHVLSATWEMPQRYKKIRKAKKLPTGETSSLTNYEIKSLESDNEDSLNQLLLAQETRTAVGLEKPNDN